jgi:origin recognition complex subunit 1
MGGQRKRERPEEAPVACHAPAVIKALEEGVASLGIHANTGSDLLGREEELKEVLQFLEATDENAPPTLQLYGMPGNGKTATVKKALSLLSRAHSSVFLNGYVMQRPSEVFTTLWRHLSLKRLGEDVDLTVSPEKAQQQLDFHFNRGNGWLLAARKALGSKKLNSVDLCVIVVDEMDKACDKDGKVLFKLVDWVSQRGSYCKLITMANAMQLPERVDQRTRSRLNETDKIVFKPYTSAQLKAIVLQRVGHIKPQLFKETTLTLQCNQIAVSNGDVRRLLQVLAAVVHEALCSTKPIAVADAKLGIIDMTMMQPIMYNTFFDRFDEYVKAVDSPLVFAIMCILTKWTMDRNTEGQSLRMPMTVLYNVVHNALESRRGKPGIGYPAWMLKVPLSGLFGAVDALRQVRFLDLAESEAVDPDFASVQRLREQRGKSVMWMTPELHVVMSQDADTMQPTLMDHGRFKELARELLR